MIDPFSITPWLALRSLPGVGVVIFHRLLRRFGSPEAVFQAAESELCRVKGVTAAMAKAIVGFGDWPRWDALLERLISLGGEVLTYHDPRFPEALRQIPYAPPFLYLLGTIEPADAMAIAIVGTRKPSHYGRKTGYRLAAELAQRGVTVVSGLARGIDTTAHQGAVEAGGRTLAVLGCGLDIVYPPENKELYRLIPRHGALLSEFPLGTPPEARNFPRRNRLISGLAQGVVIVEAGEQSGTHITANFALEQGREIYAVPGPVDLPGSVGPHRWIQQGAKLVRDAADILEEMRVPPPGPGMPGPPAAVRSPQPEDPILSHLSLTPLQLDELIRLADLPTPEVMSRLTLLELQGLIQELPGKYFVLAG
ncbi:MAG: DNA-processing protein DprA [Desulfobacca sp.]|uniref:DNA-processing protein DprA n=1 Tax=Desulfobacca sp. TaxID=2067990 RepID=UPI00404A9F7B